MPLRRTYSPVLDGAVVNLSGDDSHILIPDGEYATPFYALMQPGSLLYEVTSLPWRRQGPADSIQILSAPPGGGGGPIDLTAPLIPLSDMGTDYTYHGLEGGLYPGGTNTPPGAHVTAGLAAAALVEPLNTSGNPDANGNILVLTISMSNGSQLTCARNVNQIGASCTTGSWKQRFGAYPSRNPKVIIANGARDSQTIPSWDASTDTRYDAVNTNILVQAGYTEAQVQVVWLKNCYTDDDIAFSASLPSAGAVAYQERDGLENIITAAKTRYPNLRQVFISSRIYSYATVDSYEPFTFENGYAVRMVVERYIDGDFAPGCFVDWGPYLWAYGQTPRSDGLTWIPDGQPNADLGPDGIHHTPNGISKGGLLIHDFFVGSQFTPWYSV